MKPIACSVNWYEGYSNDPVLQIVVDKIPADEELIYEKKGVSLWFAEKDGYVRFFSSRGEENGKGYCGRCFQIKTKGGEEVTLRGSWSSRAGLINNYFTPQCLEVLIKTSSNSNGCWHSGAVTLLFALKAIKLCEEPIELVAKEFHGEYTFVPMKKGGKVGLDKCCCDEESNYHPECAPDGRDLYDAHTERTMKPSLDEQMDSPEFKMASLELKIVCAKQMIKVIESNLYGTIESVEHQLNVRMDSMQEEIQLIADAVTSLACCKSNNDVAH